MQFADDQAASRLEIDGRIFTKCDQCRDLYLGRIPPGDPPCDQCRVDLLTENQDAAKIYMTCRGQVITVKDRIVDINHVAIDAAMERCRIEDKRRCFDKVTKVFYAILNERQEKAGHESI